MDRRTRNLFVLVLAVAVIVTGGAALILGGETRPPDGGPPGTTAVVGAIVAVDSRGLGDVRGFTLRVPGGDQLEFDLARLENGTTFPPGHLIEHQATAEPVRVWYRDDGARRFAIRLEDAGG